MYCILFLVKCLLYPLVLCNVHNNVWGNWSLVLCLQIVQMSAFININTIKVCSSKQGRWIILEEVRRRIDNNTAVKVSTIRTCYWFSFIKVFLLVFVIDVSSLQKVSTTCITICYRCIQPPKVSLLLHVIDVCNLQTHLYYYICHWCMQPSNTSPLLLHVIDVCNLQTRLNYYYMLLMYTTIKHVSTITTCNWCMQPSNTSPLLLHVIDVCNHQTCPYYYYVSLMFPAFHIHL